MVGKRVKKSEERERKKKEGRQRSKREKGEVEKYVKNTFVKCYITKDVLHKMTD